MRGLTSGRPSMGLAYVALAAIVLQIALGITAPDFAAWSPAHAHVTLDGRDHAHTHAWDGAPSAPSRIPSHEVDAHPQSEPAPSRDFGIAGAAIALPAVVVLLAIGGVAVLARLVAIPVFRGAVFVPATPPPRG